MNRVVPRIVIALVFAAVACLRNEIWAPSSEPSPIRKGAAIPHAKVTITEDATGLSYTLRPAEQATISPRC